MDDERNVEDRLSEGELEAMHDPEVGTGAPEDAPWETPEAPGWLRRQPIIAVGLGILLVDLAALVTTLAQGASPVIASLLGTLAALLLLGGRWAWGAVTPVADPKLAADLPLAVMPEEGEEVFE